MILLAAAALGTALTSATAPCQLSFGRIDPLSWTGRSGQGYDPLDPVERWQEGWIYVRHDGAACSFIAAVTGASDSGERRAMGAAEVPLRYRLTGTDGRPLQDLALGGGSGLLQGSFGQGVGVAALRYRVSAPSGQSIEAGTYHDEVPLHLFLGDTVHSTAVGTSLLAVSIPVQASLDLDLAGLEGGGREVDLGELTQGATRSVAIRVRGNARYRLTVLSASGGSLVADTAGTGGALPYRLELSAGPQPIARGAAVSLHGAPIPAGTDYTLSVVVPAGAWTAAGTFRDTVVLTIEAE